MADAPIAQLDVTKEDKRRRSESILTKNRKFVIHISPALQAAVSAKVITIPSWTCEVGAWCSVRSDSSDRSRDFLVGDGPEVADRGIVFIVWVNEIIIGRRSKECFLEYLAFAFVVLFSIRAGVLFGLRVLDVLILVWIWSVWLLVNRKYTVREEFVSIDHPSFNGDPVFDDHLVG
ncbi:hypothetical protein EDD22DRAFT_849856 [Suillus occidentalis]|nr:hypothetical protein EDD22DRAFT_849856 [Suillus occidentalis]